MITRRPPLATTPPDGPKAGQLRILLVDDHPGRIALLEAALASAGHVVVAALASDADLHERVAALTPDLIIIDVDAPERDMLEGMHALQRHTRRPVVLFTRSSDRDLIRKALRAGVSAYVVGELASERVLPVLDVAIARFEDYQRLEAELADARSALAERKLIERAKGILMQQRHLAEDAAYQLMRKMAMDRNIRLVELARAVIAAAELLA